MKLADRNDVSISTQTPDEVATVSRLTLIGLAAIAEALFATEDGPPPRARLDWLNREMNDFLGRAGAMPRLAFAAMVLAVTLLSPLFIGRVRRFRNLPLTERIAALSKMERRLGEPLIAVKAILCLVYYEHPDAQREVGFDGQCLRPHAS